jgi:hypothetical protein
MEVVGTKGDVILITLVMIFVSALVAMQDRPAARRHLAGTGDASSVHARPPDAGGVAGAAAGVGETSSAALLAAVKINPIPQRRGPEIYASRPA